MPEPKHISVEDAQDEGVYGTLHDTIDNEAYTVSGQGPETAKREREQLHELRHGRRARLTRRGRRARRTQSSSLELDAHAPTTLELDSSSSSSSGGRAADADYPALGTSDGVLVIDNEAPSHDGDAYTLEGVSRPAPTRPADAHGDLPVDVRDRRRPTRGCITGTGFTRECASCSRARVERTTYVSDESSRRGLNPASWQPRAVDVRRRTASTATRRTRCRSRSPDAHATPARSSTSATSARAPRLSHEHSRPPTGRTPDDVARCCAPAPRTTTARARQVERRDAPDLDEVERLIALAASRARAPTAPARARAVRATRSPTTPRV
jgi:hypothetical protein